MQSLKVQAKRLLLEIDAIQKGNFDNRTADLLRLVNEALRDAATLAEDIIGDDWRDEESSPDETQ